MRATYLADVLRAAGLTVVEIRGWENRGRPASTGTFAPRGVLCHHTGGRDNGLAYARWLATVGRSDLPAPLAHLSLDRQGVVYVLAAGRANHAGRAKASGPMPSGDGNTLYVGVEAQNTGSEGWAPEQYQAYVTLCAALCHHNGWPASHVRAHKETSVTGKWDPGLLDMDRLRADVAERLDSGHVAAREDDMTPEQDKRLTFVEAEAKHQRSAVRSLNSKADRIGAAIRELGKALGPTVEAAVESALADATVKVDVHVAKGGE